MKKYLKNRNEDLFKKLFENQGIKPNLAEHGDEVPFNTDPSDVRPTLTGRPMDSDTLNALEGPILQGVRQMIRKGASPQQMESVLRAIDGSILYGFASDSRPYTSPFMGKNIDEIGVPEMAAGLQQQIHDEEDGKANLDEVDQDAAAVDVEADETKGHEEVLTKSMDRWLALPGVRSSLMALRSPGNITWFVKTILSKAGEVAGDTAALNKGAHLKTALGVARQDYSKAGPTESGGHIIISPNEEDK